MKPVLTFWKRIDFEGALLVALMLLGFALI
jgi:hypothetical protein